LIEIWFKEPCVCRRCKCTNPDNVEKKHKEITGRKMPEKMLEMLFETPKKIRVCPTCDEKDKIEVKKREDAYVRNT